MQRLCLEIAASSLEGSGWNPDQVPYVHFAVPLLEQSLTINTEFPYWDNILVALHHRRLILAAGRKATRVKSGTAGGTERGSTGSCDVAPKDSLDSASRCFAVD